jgi:hypothetical protein
MNTFDQLPAARPMRAEYRGALRRELEAIVATPTRQRRWLRGQFGSWTHRAVAIAVAAAVVVVFFVPLPRVSLFRSLVTPAKVGTPTKPPTKLPVVDLLATPRGWVPVAFGDGQVSVPSTWWVLYNVAACPTGSPPGEVLVNPHIVYGCAPEMAGKGPRNLVGLTVLKGGTGHGRRSLINGFLVYDDFGTYSVPSLGLHISLSGPLAQKVLHTLSHSPRTVALATGPAPSVPESWQKLSFQGLAFAAPAEWPVEHTPTYYRYFGPTMCPGMISNHVTPLAILSTDKSLASCFAGASSLPISRDGLEIPPTPRDGLEIASELRKATVKALALVFSTHCFYVNDLRVCPATTPAYSILVLRVTAPGRSEPMYVSIGLAGNGMVARTILHSLRATSRSTSPARPTTCAHNDKTFPARVWTQLVANGYMVCPVTVKRVTPFSASEAVARDVGNGAIPSTLPPLLARVGSKHGGLVGQPRHSVYWVLIDMPQLASGGPAGSCGVVAPLRGFSLDLVNANTGKWVTSAEWWPQELSLTPAPQYRAAWQHREKAQEQVAKGVAACRRKH